MEELLYIQKFSVFDFPGHESKLESSQICDEKNLSNPNAEYTLKKVARHDLKKWITWKSNNFVTDNQKLKNQKFVADARQDCDKKRHDWNVYKFCF